MHLLTISGSLQDVSANGALLDAVATAGGLAADDVVTRAVSIGDIPHFRPDREDPVDAVERFRAQLAAADAVVIATPEYAHSLPGSLKNALDWIVGTGELYGKPVVVMYATNSVQRGGLGRAALEQTLRAQGAVIVDSRSIVHEDEAAQLDDILALVRVAAAGAAAQGRTGRPRLA